MKAVLENGASRRNVGSYLGFVLTDLPLSLTSGHFGLGRGSRTHAPGEYHTIESISPAV